jgi:AcrR family transcriptional regulator
MTKLPKGAALMSLRERKKLATRNALINAARRLFVDKGYENTTLEEICKKAQIHVTTFFSYFDSKEEVAFARTLEMLEAFRTIMRTPDPDLDVLGQWWKFFYEYAVLARGVEHTIMMRMDKVPALRNRYANIVRQYEEELAAALAREAGNTPGEDVYAQLLAATILGSVVSAARWQSQTFAPGDNSVDSAVFARMIVAGFPKRADIEAEKRNQIRSTTVAAPRSRPAR